MPLNSSFMTVESEPPTVDEPNTRQTKHERKGNPRPKSNGSPPADKPENPAPEQASLESRDPPPESAAAEWLAHAISNGRVVVVPVNQEADLADVLRSAGVEERPRSLPEPDEPEACAAPVSGTVPPKKRRDLHLDNAVCLVIGMVLTFASQALTIGFIEQRETPPPVVPESVDDFWDPADLPRIEDVRIIE